MPSFSGSGQISGLANATAGISEIIGAAGVDFSGVREGNWLILQGSASTYTVAGPPTLVSGLWVVPLTAPYGGESTAGVPQVFVFHTGFDEIGIPIFQPGDTENQAILNRAHQIISRSLKNRALVYRETYVVPSGGAASYSFTLPVGVAFDDLLLTINGRSANASNSVAAIRFNADSGNNYQWSIRGSTNGTADGIIFASSSNYIEVGLLPLSTAGAGQSGSTEVGVPNYRRANFHKEVIALNTSLRGAANSFLNRQYAGVWRNTAPITSVLVFVPSGTFAEFTTISLELRGAANAVSAAQTSQIFSPRALPADVLTEQTFTFATAKTAPYVPTVNIRRIPSTSSDWEIGIRIVSQTSTALILAPINPPPDGNYVMDVEA